MTSGSQFTPRTTAASPEMWNWSMLDASRPRRATEHITHSEVTPVIVGCLRSFDAASDTHWTLTGDIPIILVDTLDACWAFERVLNKLHGFSRTAEEAKADLATKLGAHLQLLSSLESSRMAPILRLELEFLRAVMQPVQNGEA